MSEQTSIPQKNKEPVAEILGYRVYQHEGYWEAVKSSCYTVTGISKAGKERRTPTRMDRKILLAKDLREVEEQLTRARRRLWILRKMIKPFQCSEP